MKFAEAVIMERDDPDSRKSRISTIDAIGQKAAVARRFHGGGSLLLEHQLRTFAVHHYSRMAQPANGGNVGALQSKLGRPVPAKRIAKQNFVIISC